MMYELSFGGVPFVSDRGTIIRMDGQYAPFRDPITTGSQRMQQPASELIDELNKRIPFQYLQDFVLPISKPNKNLDAVAYTNELGPHPNTTVRIGDYYYPSGMRRWSVFRGLATSSQVKEMMLRSKINFTQYGLSAGPSSGTGSRATISVSTQQQLTSGGGLHVDSGGYSVSTIGAELETRFGTLNTLPEIPEYGIGQVSLPFVIGCNPEGAKKNRGLFRVDTYMYMLPPRPLGELAGGSFDGLYLVTLVDERYFMQSSPALLPVKQGMTWEFLLNELALALGIQLYTHSNIEAVYTTPELDSQLWSNWESAATLLDAIAYNVGRVVCRRYDGTYMLYTAIESNEEARRNREAPYGYGLRFVPIGQTIPKQPVLRHAGGEMFVSGLSLLPVGDLRNAKNSVIPNRVNVTFPKYIIGNDPVPHFADPRYQGQRRSTWYEDSYGAVYKCVVPIESGGLLVSGLAGTGDLYLHNTAKALLSGEIAINSGIPLNNSGLIALSMKLAQNYYNGQACLSLDEVYPGIQNWNPEGINDIVYTFSAKARGAYTRVFRKPWTELIEEYQHATPNMSGFTANPAGVGGHSVAQTIRDQFAVSGSFIGNSGTQQTISGFPLSGTYTQSGVITTTLTQTLLSGAFTASFASVNNFPTDQRWYGKIIPKRTTTGDASGVAPQTSGESEEVILFEGTSGGTYSGGIVNIVQRGTMGTIQQHHDNETPVIQVTPDAGYGVNLVTHGKGQFVYPGNQTSGGISEAKIVPQLQTVRVLDGLGISFSGVLHYSGMVNIYDSTQMISGPWINNDLAWVVERNSGTLLRSGQRYGGQFVGYSMAQSGGAVAAPVYAANLGSSPVTSDVLVQLTEKVYDGDCPTYYGFRVLDQGDCSYSDDAWPASDAVCLPIFHEQSTDLPVAPPPSPRKALPGKIVSDSSSGDVAWTNTRSAGKSDDSWAQCALQPGQTTQYLKATNFCFNLPSTTETITRIRVRVEAHASGNSVTDVEAKLVVGGAITGSSATVGNTLNTTDSIITYEFTSSLPSVSQINQDDFGFVIRYSNGSGDARTAFVDAIEIRVEFTPASDGVVSDCVVRLRLGDDETYYLTDHDPRVEPVKKRTPEETEDVDGITYTVADQARYNQSDGTLVLVRKAYIVYLDEL